jgi:hypothetical protein
MLRTFHITVVRMMAEHGHVDDEATERAASDIGRQCPDCVATTLRAS